MEDTGGGGKPDNNNNNNSAVEGGGVPMPLVESALATVAHSLQRLERDSIDDVSVGAAVLPNQAHLAALAAFAAALEPAHPHAGTASERARGHSSRAVTALGDAADALRRMVAVRPQESLVDGSRNIWVLKPSYGSKGLGVRLLNDGLATVLAEKDCQRVVQKYVERPLLLGGYKFDIRCWVLVTQWSPLTCWCYDECLLRFCSEPFALDELQNRYAHITNRAVNQQRHSLGSASTLASASSMMGGGGGGGFGGGLGGVSFGEASRCGGSSFASSSSMLFGGGGGAGGGSSRPARGGSARTVRPKEEVAAAAAAEREKTPLAGALWSTTQFDEHLRGCGLGNAWGEAVLPAIHGVAAAAMRSGVERAEPRRDAFEIYGLDLVLDEGLRPWLIEVNESPNLSTHGSAIKEQIIGPMLTSAVELVVEPGKAAAAESVGGWRRCVSAEPGAEPAAAGCNAWGGGELELVGKRCGVVPGAASRERP